MKNKKSTVRTKILNFSIKFLIFVQSQYKITKFEFFRKYIDEAGPLSNLATSQQKRA